MARWAALASTGGALTGAVIGEVKQLQLGRRGEGRGRPHAHPDRPATQILHDGPHTRLVVFRFSRGQSVPTHRNASTVMLTVLAGTGLVSGDSGERPVADGDVIIYEPNEPHAMRAPDEALVLLATIAPRPGERGMG